MRARRHLHGFTLIELMIVVAVIGILSAVAIPTFTAYVQRSRTTEAITFLGEIRQRQESYRAEFGQYCSVSAAAGSAPSAGAWNPGTLPINGNKVAWTTTDGWTQLGAVPDGLVMFQYRTTAGPPGTNPGITGFTGTEFWYVAQARGDLDGDGQVFIFEAYSSASHIYRGNASMAPLGSGWE